MNRCDIEEPRIVWVACNVTPEEYERYNKLSPVDKAYISQRLKDVVLGVIKSAEKDKVDEYA